MVRPMVHSVKHYVQSGIDQILTGVAKTVVIVQGVNTVNLDAAHEVHEGSSVKAIFFEFWIQNEGTLGEFIATITKDPDGQSGPTFGEMAALFTYTNKKNVLWHSQGLTSNDGVSGPVNIIRGWIKIPKSKQRMGLGDKINLKVANVSSNDLVICGTTTYKEYT